MPTSVNDQGDQHLVVHSLTVHGGINSPEMGTIKTKVVKSEADIGEIGVELTDRPTFAEVDSAIDQALAGEVYGQPPDVVAASAQARQDYIEVRWSIAAAEVSGDAPASFILQRSKDGGSTWYDTSGVLNGTARVQGSVYAWQFARASDGYPEPTANYGWAPLSSYRFRVKAVNAAGVESLGWATASSVDVTGYKTWKPTVPAPSARTAMRTISLSWPEESAAYARLRFEAQVSKDNSTWYEPASGLDIYANEDNWRQDADLSADRDLSTPEWTQAMPLSGQASGLPVDTTYYFRFRTVLDCPQAADDVPNGLYQTADGPPHGAPRSRRWRRRRAPPTW